MLEVELKFSVANPAALRERLSALGASPGDECVQSDAYYNHPSRDFAATDEALRIRQVGDRGVVTYKGPKQGQAAKTRYELETPLATGSEEQHHELLVRLGFRHVATVRKRRAEFAIHRGGRDFAVTIDHVDGVGVFAEVETLADEVSRSDAERAVAAVSEELGLSEPEARSYLEMLLATL